MMSASVIIPVWNGASTIADCLKNIFANSGANLHEVICVDNASHDNSASLIQSLYPHVKIIHEAVNLGFAGGVNAGIDAATGDLFILINQDCLVLPGWLDAIVQTMESREEIGIAGCTILNKDGSINHAGAYLSRPGAYGVHITEVLSNQPQDVEYVTGAVFAIRRKCWKETGRFDEGFYPAYYEEVDYCYRAAYHGSKITFIPDAKATHLLTSEEWRKDPYVFWANQNHSRYRFVIKHFRDDELGLFFENERGSIESAVYPEHLLGRALAAQDTLRHLSQTISDAEEHFARVTSSAHDRLLEVGFTRIRKQAIAAIRQLLKASVTVPNEGALAHLSIVGALDYRIPSNPASSPSQIQTEQPIAFGKITGEQQNPISDKGFQETPADNRVLEVQPKFTIAPGADLSALYKQLEDLRVEERDLHNNINEFSSRGKRATSSVVRKMPQFVQRAERLLSGRDYQVLSDMIRLNGAQMDIIVRLHQLTYEQNASAISQHAEHINVLRAPQNQAGLKHNRIQGEMNHRLELVEENQQIISGWLTKLGQQIELLNQQLQMMDARVRSIELMIDYEYR